MSLQRERLTALLMEQALTSVELVIAPPGYGKTTVLRDYASSDDAAVLVALPEATDLETFVRAIIASVVPNALRSVGAVFDGRTGTELEEQAGSWLVSRLRAFGGTLIVDDFHRAAADERVARVLIATIAATHGRMRWIIASREAPRFPMGSWIARGWMGLPISGEDLRFTPLDAANLAASLGVPVTQDAIDAIVADTLGWPIGVRLALTLVARNRVGAQTRMQTRDALFALIDDEVWQPLGAEVQQLVAAAVLIPVPSIATLIASGFTDARSGMATVFEKIPFVQAIDDDTFLIHDLFREFVTSRQPAGKPAAGIEERVGSGLVIGGNPADGLTLFVAAGNVGDVLATLATHAFDLLETGHRAAVNAALVFLGERGQNDSGESLAVRGALAFADGSPTNAANVWVRALERDLSPVMRGEVIRRLAVSYITQRMLAQARDMLAGADADPTISQGDRLEIQALRIALSTSSDEPLADPRAKIAAIEAQLPSVSPTAHVRVLHRLSYAAFALGELEIAERLAHDCVQLATTLGLDTIAAVAYGTLYSIAGLMDADTVRARSFLRSQNAAAERAANTALRVYALRAEYSFAALNADFSEADAIEAALAGLADARTYRDNFHFRIARALRFMASGETSRAESLLRTIPLAGTSPAEKAYRSSLTIVLHLLEGNRAAGTAAIERGLVVDAANEYWERPVLFRAYALRGIAYWALDRPAQARKTFGFDITLVPRRERTLIDGLRVLCELPHPLPNAHAIDDVCRRLLDADWGAFVNIIRALVAHDANDVALSAAEIETLREFDRFGGRAADVAKALGKSKFTVQNQIQSAIKKIGVSGRAEALAYARKRGWLDTTS
jgi:DNA-binding CsgD family transcriptional regulator